MVNVWGGECLGGERLTIMMVIAALVVVMVVMAAMGVFIKVVGTTTRMAVGMATLVMGLGGDHNEACPQLACALGALHVTQMQCEHVKDFARRIVGITRRLLLTDCAKMLTFV